ncbi:DUF6804 family protein [Microbacterium sp. A196]|uniref:DUF6804 family protein n=1 Tax=unclassified Microbacterium TaxID=2609290 RepID=UPI003FD3390C
MASPSPQLQRNALVPGILAAIALIISPLPLFAEGLGRTIVLFVVTILALIVAWFALQAAQWWWTIALVVIAVVWNPVFPLTLDPWIWVTGSIVGALVFVTAGAVVKNERTTP